VASPLEDAATPLEKRTENQSNGMSLKSEVYGEKSVFHALIDENGVRAKVFL